MKTSPGLLLVCILNWLCMAMAHAQPAIFQGADMKLGAQLILEHQCASCHVNKVGGNGDAIYKPQGRIQTPALLRSNESAARPLERIKRDSNLGNILRDGRCWRLLSFVFSNTIYP